MSLFILDDMIVDESNDNMENKRVKITTACDICRRRKVKCDGASPCTNCQRGGYQCVFSDASTKRPRGPPKGFVALIEDRLHTIESLLVNLVNKDTSDTKEIKREHDPPPSDDKSDHQRFSSFKIRHYSPPSVSSDAQPVFLPKPSPADPNHTKSFGDDLPEEDEEALQRSIKSLNILNSTAFLLGNPTYKSREPALPNSFPSVPQPPQEVVKQLLEKYFTHFHMHTPIVNRAQLYSQLLSTDNPVSPLLLNALCAVGAMFPPILQDLYTPTVFYERARSLLDSFIDTPRLSTVQALILLCMVDQCKTVSYRQQTYISMAIRMAQSLGLHKRNSPAYQGKYCQTKKLIWWACYALDRLSSMATGDPLLISDELCDIDLPSPDEMENQEGNVQKMTHTNASIQLVTIFLHMVKLTQLMGQIIEYSQTMAAMGLAASWAHHNTVACLEAALLNWTKELPHQLQFPPTPHNTPFSGHSAALFMHYHALQVMLFYPYILSAGSQGPNMRFNKTYIKALSICITAAQNITNIGGTLNNVYVSTAFPSIFHCLAQATKVHILNLSASKRGLLLPAYKNICRTIFIYRFYAEHGVMTELANQMVKALEHILHTNRERVAHSDDKVSSTVTKLHLTHPLAVEDKNPSENPGTIPTPVCCPYSPPVSTQSSSPTAGDLATRTQNIYIQSQDSPIQSVMNVNNNQDKAFMPIDVSNQFSSEFFSPGVITVPTTSDISSTDPQFWNVGMNLMNFDETFDTASAATPTTVTNNLATMTPPQNYSPYQHQNASTPASMASPVSSSDFKDRILSTHSPLSSLENDTDCENSLTDDVANVGTRHQQRYVLCDGLAGVFSDSEDSWLGVSGALMHNLSVAS
ncbi:1412_t:CDS:2 [Paraglomus occultum]|uniref:1412_t:CDS:1 n=1 Tax=Paraglomus occultum TaxID=144539 RepID=A0A9N9A247_9GLOM|nr:1412_t:CDS:2 [Paraglomus occultum]